VAKKITYDYLLKKGYSKREIHAALHNAILQLARDKKLPVIPKEPKTRLKP